MADSSIHSLPSTPRGNDIHYAGRTHSILIHEGKRARRQETTQSIHFAETQETFTIPEPALEDLPEFCDDDERARAIAAAKELAEAALTDESDDRIDRASAPCFACCAAPAETTASDVEADEVELTDELIEKMSSRQLNSLIEGRLSRELSRGPSVCREESFTVDKGIVSFSSFLVAKSRKQRTGDLREPVPLVDYLPPSPFLTFDGKLGVDCMAFKLEFTDKLHNIVPPFFLQDGEEPDKRAQEILKKGISYARAIDMFGPEDLEFMNQEPSAAHKDLLSC